MTERQNKHLQFAQVQVQQQQQKGTHAGHRDIILTGDKGVPCAWLMIDCMRASLLPCSCYNQLSPYWDAEDLLENCPGTGILGTVSARGCAKHTCDIWQGRRG